MFEPAVIRFRRPVRGPRLIKIHQYFGGGAVRRLRSSSNLSGIVPVRVSMSLLMSFLPLGAYIYS